MVGRHVDAVEARIPDVEQETPARGEATINGENYLLHVGEVMAKEQGDTSVVCAHVEFAGDSLDCFELLWSAACGRDVIDACRDRASTEAAQFALGLQQPQEPKLDLRIPKVVRA